MLCLHWSNVGRVTSLWRLNDWRHCVEWHSSMISLLALLSSEVRVNECHLLGRVVKSDHTVPTALHHAPADVITLIEFWRQYTDDKTARTDRCRWWSGVNVLPSPSPAGEGSYHCCHTSTRRPSFCTLNHVTRQTAGLLAKQIAWHQIVFWVVNLVDRRHE